ncbi:hypothetical protein ACFQ0M_04965 [Kitasatospora aburaviensis]
MFMAGEAEPDEQDVALGMHTHCLVTAGQGMPAGACARPSSTSSRPAARAGVRRSANMPRLSLGFNVAGHSTC